MTHVLTWKRLQTTDKQWDTILALHNTQPFKLVRAAAPYFRVKDGEPRSIVNISSTSGLHGNAGQANYALAKAGVTGLTKTIAKEWGPAFGVRANTVAFGHIATRLTAAKEEGAFVTTPDGQKVALGIPQAQKGAREAGKDAFKDIPLGRPGTATEAASAVLAVVSPLFSYVSVSRQMTSVSRGNHIDMSAGKWANAKCDWWQEYVATGCTGTKKQSQVQRLPRTALHCFSLKLSMSIGLSMHPKWYMSTPESPGVQQFKAMIDVVYSGQHLAFQSWATSWICFSGMRLL